jgi:CRISPR-associated endoribonuclease Cas6
MADLAAFTLHVRPTHQDTIPAWTGRSAHAWFLSTVQAIDPALSAAIHDDSLPRPFTVSGLRPAPRGELLHLKPQQTYTLRITTLHCDLTQIALNALVPMWLDKGAQIHDQPLHVAHVETQTSAYCDLMRERSHRSIRLRFVTPTMFKRTGDMQLPLPLPDYVFDNLAKRWQSFGGDDLPTDLVDFTRLNVSVERHRISTQQVQLSRSRPMVGFVGDVTFRLHSSRQPYVSALHALVDFAAFSSVGAKTTFGLGQVETTRFEKEGNVSNAN